MMEEIKKQRGGYRAGAGRKESGRDVPLSIRISKDAMDKLNAMTDNKSAYIDKLILSL